LCLHQLNVNECLLDDQITLRCLLIGCSVPRRHRSTPAFTDRKSFETPPPGPQIYTWGPIGSLTTVEQIFSAKTDLCALNSHKIPPRIKLCRKLYLIQQVLIVVQCGCDMLPPFPKTDDRQGTLALKEASTAAQRSINRCGTPTVTPEIVRPSSPATYEGRDHYGRSRSIRQSAQSGSFPLP
jgi:hypothetical protein